MASAAIRIRNGIKFNAGPGEGADKAENERNGRQLSDEDETPGNPDEDAKDLSESSPLKVRGLMGAKAVRFSRIVIA